MRNYLKPSMAIILLMFLLGWSVLIFEQLRQSRYMQIKLQGKAAELDRQLHQLAVLPRVLARHPYVISSLSEQTQTNLLTTNKMLRQSQLDSKSAFAFVMDIDGNTIASSNYADSVSFIGVNYGFRPYFTKAIANGTATFFAVGATTGIPGYFTASAVTAANKTIGVAVVKTDLGGLLDSWQLRPYEWVVVDEMGVVALATDKRFLYVPAREITDNEKQNIASDRRYKITPDTRLIPLEADRIEFHQHSKDQTYFTQKTNLNSENWELMLLLTQTRIWLRAAYWQLAIGSILIILWLIYRNMLAQKRLAATEHKHAMALELEVAERTRELRSAQEALITESNYAMLGRMSAAINHEINQPLASLRLNLASLRNVVDKPDVDIHELRQIVVDSDRTTKRIGRVVTTLRSLASQRATEHVSLEVDKLVTTIVETIKRERRTMAPSLVVEFKNKNMRVNGNEILLQQALLNLLYNAFDAVLKQEQRIVKLQLTRLDRTVQFSVLDNGPGVSKEIVPHLFKPFFSDNTKPSGLGLGLTLTELIAQEHQGELTYELLTPQNSDYPAGSKFSLFIPLHQGTGS
ncbi:hypothetical protein AB833_02755 [Chromatiales bacterium (ex Bugula neritina AB1)]|nr:hypothetical protein AB833_02755 [Chromatiales bacterium (ex Bugula neritina AB1)]